jgi:hypothetical protein
LQGEILRLLAAHRNPESYVARGTVLNRDGPRFLSKDGIGTSFDYAARRSG